MAAYPRASCEGTSVICGKRVASALNRSNEGQECDLGRQGEASGNPVATCDDPTVTCNGGYGK